MERASFFKYKKFVSFILCVAYILQLLAFNIVNIFGKQSTKDPWTFLIGFSGINLFLIFLLDFFHFGIPKTPYSFLTILPLLLTSGGCYYMFYHQPHWATTTTLIVAIAILLLVFRHVWCVKLFPKHFENQTHLQEEGVIRFSLYFLPVLFLSVICYHIENTASSPFFSVFVHALYTIISFSIVSLTYIKWYRCINKPISLKMLAIENGWLFLAFIAFVIGIKFCKNAIIVVILPIMGVCPILIRHKTTQ